MVTERAWLTMVTDSGPRRRYTTHVGSMYAHALFLPRPSALHRGQIPADATQSSSSAHTTSKSSTAAHVATALGLSALLR